MSPTIRASYELLGVAPGAGTTELKRAYHQMALLYHPDRNPDPSAVTEFRKVTEAYDLLADPARVAELNRRYLRERLHRPVIEGFEITFGSFFGYRLFDFAKTANAARMLALTGQSEAGVGASTSSTKKEETWLPLEENNSILDNAAYDAIEVVYAGKLSLEDEMQLRGETERTRLAQLPWVVLNNQGILRFLDGDLRGARKCYLELCERVPNNIIFMYRLGLLYVLDGFQNPRRTFIGTTKPDRIKIERGIELFKHCLKLGEERPVGRQKCLVIRKILADVYARTGQSRRSARLWQDIYREDPASAEAALHVRGQSEAAKIIRRKSHSSANPAVAPSLLQLNSSRRRT